MEEFGKEIHWPITDDSIQMLIQYRSLYILKRKFEVFKLDIMTLYSSFASPSSKESLKDHKVIDISGFEPLLNSIALLTNILIIPITKPNELYIVDLYNQTDNETKSNETKHKISLFAEEYIASYNEKYYNKRLSKPVIPEPAAKPPIEDQDDSKWIAAHPMTQYDKKGKVIYTFQQLRDMNSLDYDAVKARKRKGKEEVDEKDIIEKGKLFAETLPLIVADYIQRNPNVVIIDLDRENSDLITEVRGIFDKEIIRKLAEDLSKLKSEIEEMNNESNAKLNKLKEQYNTITKNIELYQRLLVQAEATSDPNAVYFREILAKLLSEKQLIEDELIKCVGANKNDKANDNIQVQSDYMNQLKSDQSINKSKDNSSNLSKMRRQAKSNDSLLTKEERRENALREIFHFYANQHNFAGLYPLFESIQKKINHLDLSEFSKFFVEFKIDISKETLVELFKKNSFYRKQMNYKEFKGAIRKISLAMNTARKAYLNKKIEKTKEHLVSMMNKNSSELNQFRRRSIFSTPKLANDNKSTEKEDHNTHRVPPKRASFLFNAKRNQMGNELASLETELNLLTNYTHEHILEQFYIYLGIDAEYSYRKKMKGFIIPFHNMEERNLFWDDEQLNNKLPSIKNYNNIQRLEISKLEQRREQQLKESKLKKLKNDLYHAKLSELKTKNLKLEVHSVFRLKDATYQDILNKEGVNKQIEAEITQEKNRDKYTWEKIEKMEELDDLKLEENNMNNHPELEDLFSDSDNSDNLEIIKHLNTNDQNNGNGNKIVNEDINNIRVLKSKEYGNIFKDDDNEKIGMNINFDHSNKNTFKPSKNVGANKLASIIKSDGSAQKDSQLKKIDRNQGDYKLFQKNNDKLSNDSPLMNYNKPLQTEPTIEKHSKEFKSNLLGYTSNIQLASSKDSPLKPIGGNNNRYTRNPKETNRKRPLITSVENNIYSLNKLNERTPNQIKQKNTDTTLLIDKSQEKSTFERLLESRSLQEKLMNSQNAKTIHKLENHSIKRQPNPLLSKNY